MMMQALPERSFSGETLRLVEEHLTPTAAAGLFARTALAVANRRMGGPEPPPYLENEGELRERLIEDVRRRLQISSEDQSPEAYFRIEAAFDREIRRVDEPVDYEAAFARIEASGLLDPDRPELREIRRIEGHGDEVWAVAVTPDGRRAVSASDDRTLKVWDLEAGALLSTLEGHGAGVMAVAVTADGRRAVSGSYDRTLRLWDLETGDQLAMFTAEAPVLSCAITADGRLVVAGDAEGRIHVVEILA